MLSHSQLHSASREWWNVKSYGKARSVYALSPGNAPHSFSSQFFTQMARPECGLDVLVDQVPHSALDSFNIHLLEGEHYHLKSPKD